VDAREDQARAILRAYQDRDAPEYTVLASPPSAAVDHLVKLFVRVTPICGAARRIG
jgi:hypothetical protein